MRTLTLACAALLLSPLAISQEIYRWVDSTGVVHYSDQPGAPDAERIIVRGYVGSADGGAELPEPYVPDGSPPAGMPDYGSLAINRPTADAVFFGTDATVTVEVSLDAELRSGDTVAIFLDGQRIPSDGLSAELQGVARGTHQLRAAVVDPGGNVLVSSQQIAFHVRQTSVAQPPTGPTVPPVRPPTGPNLRPVPAPRN